MLVMRDAVAKTAMLVPEDGDIFEDAIEHAIAGLADSDIESVTIELSKEFPQKEPLQYEWLLKSGWKIRSWLPTAFRLIKILR